MSFLRERLTPSAARGCQGLRAGGRQVVHCPTGTAVAPLHTLPGGRLIGCAGLGSATAPGVAGRGMPERACIPPDRARSIPSGSGRCSRPRAALSALGRSRFGFRLHRHRLPGRPRRAASDDSDPGLSRSTRRGSPHSGPAPLPGSAVCHDGPVRIETAWGTSQKRCHPRRLFCAYPEPAACSMQTPVR